MKDMEYFVKINHQEAMLIDWVLRLQSWDKEVLDYLLQMRELRANAGKIILGQIETLYIADKEEMELLLMIVPITFRFLEADIGYTLKTKLYQAYLGVKDASQDNTKSPGGYSTDST